MLNEEFENIVRKSGLWKAWLPRVYSFPQKMMGNAIGWKGF